MQPQLERDGGFSESPDEHSIVNLRSSTNHAVMLLATLMVSIVTFASGETNVLQRAVHIVLFLVYIILIFG